MKESELYGVIYGGTEIMTRIEELTVRPIAHATHQGPIDVVREVDALPVWQIRLDRYSAELNHSRPSTTATPGRVGKPEDVPRLVLPSSSARRSHPMVSSSRSVYATPGTPQSPLDHLELEAIQMPASIFPLHFFDEECCDLFVFDRILDGLKDGRSLSALSPYCFDRETLVWTACTVVNYDRGLFRVTWPDSEGSKEIHRISLRFEFDDVGDRKSVV
jgi:hypothetical protein